MFIRCLLVFAFACALIALPGRGFGQGPAQASPATKAGASQNAAVEQELIKLTQEFAAAERGADAPTLDRLTSDDFTFTHSSGNVQPKASYVESLKVGTRRYENFDLENVTVRLYGTAAITSGHVHVKVGGSGRSTHDFQAQCSFTWIQQQGWRMVALQLTEIPQRPAGSGSAR